MHDLLSAAAKELLFIFDNSLCRQIDEVAMSSPLGPTLENESCLVEFKPKHYKRYVDGIFVMFQSMYHVKRFVDYMNMKHPNIRFTLEIEDQNSFLFLDMKVVRVTKGF